MHPHWTAIHSKANSKINLCQINLNKAHFYSFTKTGKFPLLWVPHLKKKDNIRNMGCNWVFQKFWQVQWSTNNQQTQQSTLPMKLTLHISSASDLLDTDWITVWFTSYCRNVWKWARRGSSKQTTRRHRLFFNQFSQVFSFLKQVHNLVILTTCIVLLIFDLD